MPCGREQSCWLEGKIASIAHCLWPDVEIHTINSCTRQLRTVCHKLRGQPAPCFLQKPKCSLLECPTDPLHSKQSKLTGTLAKVNWQSSPSTHKQAQPGPRAMAPCTKARNATSIPGCDGAPHGGKQHRSIANISNVEPFFWADTEVHTGALCVHELHMSSHPACHQPGGQLATCSLNKHKCSRRLVMCIVCTVMCFIDLLRLNNNCNIALYGSCCLLVMMTLPRFTAILQSMKAYCIKLIKAPRMPYMHDNSRRHTRHHIQRQEQTGQIPSRTFVPKWYKNLTGGASNLILDLGPQGDMNRMFARSGSDWLS